MATHAWLFSYIKQTLHTMLYMINCKPDYKKILQDRQILELYSHIDDAEKAPWAKHGMEHILRVVKNAKTLCKLLKIDKNTTFLTIIASILHDAGATEGKKNHREKSAIFAQNYLKNAHFNETDAQIIVEAIRHHASANPPLGLVHILLVCADKLDCSQSRILPSGYGVVGMRQSQFIKTIKLKMKSEKLFILFKVSPHFDKTEFTNYYFTKLLYEALDQLSKQKRVNCEIVFKR